MTTTLHIVLIIALILVVPVLFRKTGLPSIVGLILAGVAVGPYGFGLIERTEIIQVFSNIGLYYIMFTSGIEIDMNDFQRNSSKTFIFGAYTFVIPFLVGFGVSYWLIGLNIAASMLLAAMFASHTLMTYPTVSRYGIQRNSIVGITVGGTIIAVTLSIIIIATVSSFLPSDNTVYNSDSLLRMVIFILLFAAYLIALPTIGHFIFKHTNDTVLQFTFVMLSLFCAVLLAQLAGLEGILGAFFAGLMLNRLIPNLSPLMHRISFVGNAVFIPIFLISVGMLVNLGAFVQGWNTLIVAAIMCVVALSTKWIAAWATQKTCHYSDLERQLMFGLSGAKAAVSLAAVMIGYNIIDDSGNHLLNDDILNSTVVMILITCTVSGIITERAAKKISEKDNNIKLYTQHQPQYNSKDILLPLANPTNAHHLLDLAFLCADPKQGTGISALRVVKHSDYLPEAEEELNHISKIANAADRPISCHIQVAANIANGISEVANRLEVKDIIIGTNDTTIQLEDINMMRDGKRQVTYGNVINQLISNQSRQIGIYKAAQPINTIHRLIIAIPAQAEKESGFLQLYERLRQIAAQTASQVVIYANRQTISLLQTLDTQNQKNLPAVYRYLDDWNDFLLIAKEVQRDDMLIIVQSRKNTTSYNPAFVKMPYILYRFFKTISWLVLYPEQLGTVESDTKLI